jgi:hypothetical protein
MQSKKIYSSLSLSLSIKYKFPTIATATFAWKRVTRGFENFLQKKICIF